jgi:transposase
MLTLNISDADIEHVKYERIQYPLARIRVRFDALYLTSQGYSRHQVSELTGLHRNTITKYIKTYNEGGLEQLKVLRRQGPKSCLSGHEQSLEAYFRAHPPLPLVSMIWSFTRIFIKAAAGRNRINVLGAMDAVTLQVYALINTTYINAQSVTTVLEMLSQRCKKGPPIYVVLDNARYQHCDFVKAYAKNLGITLVFLPPYSPNLNLIERLWKYIKKDILANRYFESADLFHEAVLDALNLINHCPKTKTDLKSLITHNFQSFAQKLTQ